MRRSPTEKKKLKRKIRRANLKEKRIKNPGKRK